jgi:hypothetical protein
MEPQDPGPSPSSADALLPDAASATAGPIIGPGKKKRGRSSDDEKEAKADEGADVDVDGCDDGVFISKKQKAEENSNEGIDDANEEEDDDVGGDDLAIATTRRIGSSIDFPLSNLRPHLICSLCEGYFRDPYTVADCLHTFCRSCLILFFRQGMRCCPTW